MTPELDNKLYNQYPKLFAHRNSSSYESAMAWGLAVNDGWYNIINVLCYSIQSRIDYSRKQRASAIKYNRALTRALSGDTDGMSRYFSSVTPTPQWAINFSEKAIDDATYKLVPDAVPQLIVMQVKEKFGTLRFYADGGDTTTYCMINMAESMSSCTCEQCGSPGILRSSRWARTLCDLHVSQE
jgi:hypothetical protein